MEVTNIVTKIPKKSDVHINGEIIKKNVCVYARVSTIKDLQKSSFELQVSTYIKTIENNPIWKFAGIFADYGKSGTNILHRTEFNKMIELARLKQIDIILTKSVSRFTRNTVDGLKTMQELRELGVEIIFEKENLSTNDSAFDFFLTVYTSVAEEEARINSSNVLWTYKKKMSEGGNTTSRIYGYIIDKEGNYIINEKQAGAVRLAYKLYKENKTLNQIIDAIEEAGYKTYHGKDRFTVGALNRLLRNEKYIGDMLLQKTTNKGVGIKASIKNRTKPSYYVTNNHEAIIDRDTFETVQIMIKERAKVYSKDYNTRKPTLYSNYVYSLIANKFYRTKVNHRNTSYEVKLLEVLDENKKRILDAKNIYYSQIDILLKEGTKTLVNNLDNIKTIINNDLNNKLLNEKLIDKLDIIKTDINKVKSEIKLTKNSDIDPDLKKTILTKHSIKLNELKEEQLKLKHQRLMTYDYSNNLPLLIKRLKSIDLEAENDYKELFSYVVAKSREELILCIHLSNRNLSDIDLTKESTNESVSHGSFPFKQSRLLLDTVWSIIVI